MNKRHKSNLLPRAYYLRVTQYATALTLALFVLITVAEVFRFATYSWSSPAGLRYFIQSVSFIFYSLILFGGGFVIGMLVTRHKPDVSYERLVVGGAYGLLALIIYSSFISVLFRVAAETTWLPYGLPVIGPVVTLAVVALVALVIRAFSPRIKSVTMGLFVAVVLISQIVSLIETVMVATGHVTGAQSVWPPLWIIIPGFATMPLLTGAVFYALTVRIPRVARLFYAIYLATIINYIQISLFDFTWGPQIRTFDIIQAVSTYVGFGLFIATVIFLIRLRRKQP